MDYYHIDAEHLGEEAKIPLVKLGQTGEVFYQIALDMIETIEETAKAGRPCTMIVPVGPVGQYPIFVRLVNERKISLKHVTFINMDEYLTDDKKYIAKEDRLSFRGFMERTVYSQIAPDLVMPEEQRIFPDPDNLDRIPNYIAEHGVDLCIGGIGLTGHVAFNEPEDVSPEEFLTRQTRVLEISPETRTTNSIGDLNGAIEDMPRYAVTIGFNDIYQAKKIRLYVFREWHRSVIRRAAYGEVTAQCPVTLLQKHPDVRITANEVASQKAY